jgi:transglutaminase-like putative cysteine protease
VVGLAYLAGESLSGTGWAGDSSLGFAGLVAASLMVVLAYLKVGGRAPLAGVVIAVIVAVALFAYRDLKVGPSDPHSAAIAGVWARRLILDAALGSGLFHAFFFYFVAWVSGGWLAWSIARLRKPLLGLLPVTAVFAIGLLNSTSSDSLRATLFLALLLALLLLTSFRRLRRQALGSGHSLSATVSRRYWAVGSGIVVSALLGSAVMPPLSTTDMSGVLQGQLSAVRAWLGDPTVGAGHAGFSLEAPLSGPLAGDSQVVFTYTVPTGSAAAAPVYFRGADLTLTSAGQWRFATNSQQGTVAARMQIPYAESYQDTTSISVVVQPVNPPPAAPSTLFYPGQLVTSSAPLVISQSSTMRGRTSTQAVRAVDLAEMVGSLTSVYVVESLVSAAPADQLRVAGSAYPAWVLQFARLGNGFRFSGGTGGPFTSGTYRPAATLQRIHELALSITANATNPYDQAMSVESYLRSNYKYSLSPPATPTGKDPIDQFLFTSKTGYCQFFATAMGDMLRSLGIPTRLVNGFGPGSPSSTNGQYVVTESDAHTWVEAYFPAFGWIPFEPTPQAGYSSIQRGLAVVPSASQASTPALSAPPAAAPTSVSAASQNPASSSPISAGGPWLVLLIALLLPFAVPLVLMRWRPRSIRNVWRRVRAASYLAGAHHNPAETPIEFGRRLTRRFPAAAGAIETLTGHFSRAAYGGGPTETVSTDTFEALTEFERHLARSVLHSLTFATIWTKRFHPRE